jgi:hypothetical protein
MLIRTAGFKANQDGTAKLAADAKEVKGVEAPMPGRANGAHPVG